MVIVTLLLLIVLFITALWCLISAKAHKLSEDDLWLDEPSPLTAADQEVVDIALALHDLNNNEVKETDYEKRSNMRREMNAQSKRLVKTIMAVNLLEPVAPEPSNEKVISMADFLNKR